MFEAFKNLWGNKAKLDGALSHQQCQAAHAVFGDSNEEVNQACNIKPIAKQIYKAVSDEIGLDDILDNIKLALTDIQDGILELDEFRQNTESAEFEKSFFTSRQAKALYGDNWPVRTKIAPQEPKNGARGGDWIDSAIRNMADKSKSVPRPQNKNIYGVSDLRPGKLRF